MLAAEEIRELFDQVVTDVVSASARMSIELDINQLQQITPAEHEHLAILFDLAEEELATPEFTSRYLSLDQIRARQHADDTTLTKALQRFERIVQAPFSIKAKRAATGGSSSYRQPIARAALKVVAAEPRARLSALWFDMIISGGLALIVALVLIPLLEADLVSELQASPGKSLSLYLPLIAIYLKILLITMILYPGCMLLRHGKTPGLSRNRIKLVSTNGAPPISVQIVVRTLLAPLSLLLLSPIAVINGRRTIGDYLSRTTISKI